jgi:hypothetical protein
MRGGRWEGTQLIISVTADVSVTYTHAVLCCCVQVYGSAPTAHGLISEAFLGTAAPDTAAAAAAVPGVDNLAAGLDINAGKEAGAASSSS